MVIAYILKFTLSRSIRAYKWIIIWVRAGLNPWNKSLVQQLGPHQKDRLFWENIQREQIREFHTTLQGWTPLDQVSGAQKQGPTMKISLKKVIKDSLV